MKDEITVERIKTIEVVEPILLSSFQKYNTESVNKDNEASTNFEREMIKTLDWFKSFYSTKRLEIKMRTLDKDIVDEFFKKYNLYRYYRDQIEILDKHIKFIGYASKTQIKELDKIKEDPIKKAELLNIIKKQTNKTKRYSEMVVENLTDSENSKKRKNK